ncbi:MAG: glycosyltransferase [Holosporaceae bacterium]|jgi:hypothetical protein|nr:glycosyltransferase [Holosporaceae bacterium]
MQNILTEGKDRQLFLDNSLKNNTFPLPFRQKRSPSSSSQNLTPQYQSLNNLSSPKTESTSAKPFMSVVIPAYNAEKTILRCVRSLDAALCQIDHEILIIDDASTDNTAAIVQKLTDVYENVRLIQQKKNAGPGPARNRGLNEACGEFIWFMDADDEVPVKNFHDLDICQICADQDVVIFRHNQIIPGVKEVLSWNYDEKIMVTRPADNFTVAEFPSILITFNSACNNFGSRVD